MASIGDGQQILSTRLLLYRSQLACVRRRHIVTDMYTLPPGMETLRSHLSNSPGTTTTIVETDCLGVESIATVLGYSKSAIVQVLKKIRRAAHLDSLTMVRGIEDIGNCAEPALPLSTEHFVAVDSRDLRMLESLITPIADDSRLYWRPGIYRPVEQQPATLKHASSPIEVGPSIISTGDAIVWYQLDIPAFLIRHALYPLPDCLSGAKLERHRICKMGRPFLRLIIAAEEQQCQLAIAELQTRIRAKRTKPPGLNASPNRPLKKN